MRQRGDRPCLHRAASGQCARLASLPGTLGRARPDLRSFPFGNYVIFFRYRDDVLEVVNVLEGHRDIDAFFSESTPPEE